MKIEINFDKKYFIIEMSDSGDILIRQNIEIEAIKRDKIVLVGGQEVNADRIYDSQKALLTKVSDLITDPEMNRPIE